MRYLLVLWVTSSGPTLVPDVIEIDYPTAIECWSAGFSAKTRDPARVRSWSCERQIWLPELERREQ